MMFYHNDYLAWDWKAYLSPVHHYCSELNYPCPTHTGLVQPLLGMSHTCVEAALKISSTLFSIEELRINEEATGNNGQGTIAKLSPSSQEC